MGRTAVVRDCNLMRFRSRFSSSYRQGTVAANVGRSCNLPQTEINFSLTHSSPESALLVLQLQEKQDRNFRTRQDFTAGILLPVIIIDNINSFSMSSTAHCGPRLSSESSSTTLCSLHLTPLLNFHFS
jgi:hypothetical protein